MTSFGTYIRSEREDRGFTLDEIAEISRINPCLLDSLECDRIEQLPPLPIVKGFIRSYAQILGMPPEDAVLRYIVYHQSTNRRGGPPDCGGRKFGRTLRRIHGYLTGNGGHQVF